MKKINSIIKKLALACLVMFAGTQMYAQERIELNPSSRGVQIKESTFKGFQSTFSFSTIESNNVKTEAGDFSLISINKTVLGGEEGGPSLPIARELVAVPFGATPVVNVVSYTSTDYKLSDYGIDRVYPQQPSYSKSAKAEEIVFHYNEKAYQTRSLDNAPKVDFEVLGTMRGIQLGALQIEPVSYNPANNTIRVFNDIELEVVFENADVALTEQTLVDSYSPYFDVVYKQLFNTNAINDVYDEHPDLYAVPVKMLVIANRMFEDALQPWIEWKTQKGFYLDVKYTDQIGSTSNDIKSYIQQQYNTNKPSFLVIVGDKAQVAPSVSAAEETGLVSDLYYSSVDGDIFPDIYHSRMSCETVAQVEAVIEKVLQYEKYTMPDPSYLKNVLLIAGHDDWGWTSTVGIPTIQYATTYYYNEEHGYEGVHDYLGPNYSGCYNHLSEGVGFANYTAHGGKTSWSDPSFTVSQVHALTNTDKYFWAMGNCCIAADWGYSSECFGEAMIRSEKKGAWGYIGSCPNTYWWEDYYFAVGATTVSDRMPTYEETSMGNYDAMWMEDSYNSLSAVPYVGNLAVVYAHAMNYPSSSAATNQYYWEAYHTLGDGSVMPYKAQPTENNVTHLPTVPLGTTTYNITAAPYSYVGISQGGELYGAGMVDETGSTDIEIAPITNGGDVTIVVTHPNHIPYVKTVPAASLDGTYMTVASCTPNQIPVNKETYVSVVVKNVGTEASASSATMTISCDEDFVTITDATATINTLAPDAEAALENAFALKVTEALEDGTVFKVNYVITVGNDSWEGQMAMKVVAPEIQFNEFMWAGAYQAGATYTVAAKFENKGSYKAENVKVAATTASQYITIAESEYTIGTIDAGGIGIATFDIIIAASSPENIAHEINFALTADNGVTAEGTGIVRNACEVEFVLSDSYGDGWGESSLTVNFNDGTPDVNINMADGSTYTHTLTIGSGTHVKVYFNGNDYWNYECSYLIRYPDGTLIYNSNGEPNYGLNVEFDVECGAGEGVELNPVQNLNAEVNMNQVTLTWNAPRGFVNYVVLRNGVQIAETEETTYVDSEVANGTHTYNVVAVYEEGESVPASVVVIVGESIDENEVMFAIYPNPAKDFVMINSNAATYEYQLINSLGQVVVSGSASGEHQIDVANINKGVYFLKVVADGETAVNKLLIQ